MNRAPHQGQVRSLSSTSWRQRPQVYALRMAVSISASQDVSMGQRRAWRPRHLSGARISARCGRGRGLQPRRDLSISLRSRQIAKASQAASWAKNRQMAANSPAAMLRSAMATAARPRPASRKSRAATIIGARLRQCADGGSRLVRLVVLPLDVIAVIAPGPRQLFASISRSLQRHPPDFEVAGAELVGAMAPAVFLRVIVPAVRVWLRQRRELSHCQPPSQSLGRRQ